jgi:hypothetical protein
MKPQILNSTLTFQLKSSISLSIVFLFIYFGGLFCICFTTINIWIKTALIIYSTIYLILISRKYALKNTPNAVIEFWQDQDNNHWYLKKNAKILHQAILDYPVFISSYLIMARFICNKEPLKIIVLITRDSLLTSDHYRRLKILLKIHNKN